MAANYTTSNVIYLLNGNDLSTWKAFIVKSDNFLSLPKRKDKIAYNWPDEHGEDIDLTTVYFEPSDYDLEIIMYADTLAALQANIKLLIAELSKTGLQHLKMAGIAGVTPFYTNGHVSVENLTGISSTQAAARVTFSIRNPNPINRQFWTTKASINLTSQLYIVTTKALTINWGDGNIEAIAAGTITKIHTFTAIGTYCIVVYGGVDGITTITPTNCTAI
jgi:hypothetical protein